jgi:beta-N-acetylhexosaminidase
MRKKVFIILVITVFSLVIVWERFLWGQTSVSLEHKIGQMIMVGFDGSTLGPNDPIVQDILNQRITGVILFDYNFKTKTFDKNIKNPDQLKSLTVQLQNYAEQAVKRYHNQLSPLLISVDYEGGRVNRLKSAYGFPETVSEKYLGEQPLEITQKYSHSMAMVLRKMGINLNFSPVVDLAIDPDNEVIVQLERSFSDNPNKVVDDAKVFIRAYKDQQILCALKHFPGHGSSKGDTHQGFVDVSKTWKVQEMIPYQQLIKNNQSCDLIMTAHVINRKLDTAGYPASLSYQMTTDLLRKQLGFQGVVITDDLQMGAITENYDLESSVKLAILAGADILLFCNQLKYQPHIAEKVIKIISKLVKEGVISKERINLSYNRIIALKKKLV